MKGDNKDKVSEKVSESGLVREKSVKGDKIPEQSTTKIQNEAVGEKSEIELAAEEIILKPQQDTKNPVVQRLDDDNISQSSSNISSFSSKKSQIANLKDNEEFIFGDSPDSSPRDIDLQISPLNEDTVIDKDDRSATSTKITLGISALKRQLEADRRADPTGKTGYIKDALENFIVIYDEKSSGWSKFWAHVNLFFAAFFNPEKGAISSMYQMWDLADILISGDKETQKEAQNAIMHDETIRDFLYENNLGARLSATYNSMTKDQKRSCIQYVD